VIESAIGIVDPRVRSIWVGVTLEAYGGVSAEMRRQWALRAQSVRNVDQGVVSFLLLAFPHMNRGKPRALKKDFTLSKHDMGLGITVCQLSPNFLTDTW